MNFDVKLIPYKEEYNGFLETLKLDKEITDNVTSIFYGDTNKYIITANNDNVGVCLINKEHGNIYSLDLAISKDYRGKGIGSKAVELIFEIISHDEDCKKIIFRTKMNNLAVKALAEKQGCFQDYDEIQRTILEGVPTDVYSKINDLEKVRVR